MATAATVYRDYETDGVPASGAHKPKKSSIRELLVGYETIINAFLSSGGLVFPDKAAADASLGYPAYTMAWVIKDAIVANNGIYRKVSASGAGSWLRLADLPYSFIIASDAGAGTANAIQATTSIPVSSSALVWMNVFEANTASPVTVSFNGGTALTMKTNGGNNIAVGGLVAGMIVMGIVAGATFRLISDQSSAALLAQVEAAATRAEAAQAAAEAAAASVDLPPVAPNRMLVDNAAGTARESKTFGEIADLLDVNRSFASFGAVGDGSILDDAAISSALTSGKVIDGRGLVYKVSAKPSSFLNIRNAAFKVGNVIYPSREYMRTDTAKITNGFLYTAWAQDKAYRVGTQLRVWVNEKESHPDGTGRIALYFSDDKGATWSFGQYLSAKATGQTLWSAGFDGTDEYLFVRVPSGTTDVPPYTYTMWKRALGAAGSENYNGTWTKTNITFPVPSGFTGQPVMVHSFTVGHSNSIVVGASYGEGAAVMRSTDGGVNWTETILGTGSDFEEPTVRYHATSGLYVGFIRNGGSGEPRYWRSTDNLATAGYFSAATGYFGGGVNSDSCVSFDIDEDGYIHATTAYRNGVIEDEGTDERVSAFYLRGPVTSGNFWTDANTQVFNIAQLPRREQGGASALSQGSVIVDEDRVHLFYGMEERTGVTGGLGKGNRVANIYQTVIYRDDRGTMFDDRADMAVNRAGHNQLRKLAGIDAFVLPFNDASNWGPTIVSGRPNYARHTSTLTIASGVLTLTGTRAGLYVIDTEGAAAADDLDTITDADAFDGDTIVLKTSSSNRDVTIKNGTGNINAGADRVLNSGSDQIMLMYFGGTWYAFPYADNT
ncbi:hypothetical protein [Sinorhizobium meliloti]|uniref:hypothetical protein n=1 Tax=Rhizobium meliloti TaxID=382 RepID=UPI000FD27D10|nr:hypothetical protein [Sinorhizobium meliloti]RVN85099.1 hypothetical protein CN101_23515 [Sinorhizobium meliloti]RVO54362.1 hypothetical protein CN094_26840 [Sinorhizobium meliloti]